MNVFQSPSHEDDGWVNPFGDDMSDEESTAAPSRFKPELVKQSKNNCKYNNNSNDNNNDYIYIYYYYILICVKVDVASSLIWTCFLNDDRPAAKPKAKEKKDRLLTWPALMQFSDPLCSEIWSDYSHYGSQPTV